MCNKRQWADFKYDIVEHIGVLSENTRGWAKEINLISWNGDAIKYAIRDWVPEHERMSKGVTLTDDEAQKLADEAFCKETGMTKTVAIKKICNNILKNNLKDKRQNDHCSSR